MSIADEILRLQTAKGDLKTAINAKTDAQHKIVDETIDEYAGFIDYITGGGGGDTTQENVAYAKQMDLMADVMGQKQIVERDYTEAEMTKLENVLINLTQGVEVNG